MSRFSIDFEWLSREGGDPVARATFAEVTIRADQLIATELEDLQAKTVRPHMRVSAYTLAQWFAFNWWRLRWEPERKTSFSWKMSHKVGAAGEGYLWPDLTFISDGASVLIETKSPSLRWEQPVRYLNDFEAFVTSDEFEGGIDKFIEGVIGRLINENLKSAELVALWREVVDERRDPKLAAWRKLEAVMGFDPGDAPDELIKDLQKAGHEYGESAVEEMAAASMRNALADIEALWKEPRRRAVPLKVSRFDKLHKRILEELQPSYLPWERATEAARMAREIWSLSPGPVTNSMLSELFDISRDTIEKPSVTKGPISAGFRDGNMDTATVFLKSPYPVNRRFALLRLVGDQLTAPQKDRLLPAAPTFVKTQRQKFQRAFAQEFLCPYAELKKYLGSAEISDDFMEDAANYFDVSERVIETILVNKGHLERSHLAP